MQNRLFALLPRDVRQIIWARTPMRDLIHVRAVTTQNRMEIDNFFAVLISEELRLLNFLATRPREDIALFLRHFYASDSPAYLSLKKRIVEEGDVSATAYAVYALVTNVNELDLMHLQHVIKKLTTMGCPARMLDSLRIIECYLRQKLKNSVVEDDAQLGARSLREMVTNTAVAYINLHGADLTGCNFCDCDLSFADFRATKFYACATRANLMGVDFRHACFDARTVLFDITQSKGMLVDGLTIGQGFVVDYEMDVNTNETHLEIPELAPVIARRDEENNRANDQSCSLM